MARTSGIADAFAEALGGSTVRFQAYDGSEAGPPDAPVVIDLRSPKATSYLLTAPGVLGLGRAYVSGELDVRGDMHSALAALSTAGIGTLGLRDKMRLLRALDLRNFRIPEPPALEVTRLRGLRHSFARDGQVISYHYDVSNRFYEYVLGPSMAYTCAVYPTVTSTLEEAQYEKHDLVARKLDLKRGQRLLDVGCGWGGMVMHAAQQYGVRALGVTLSRQQAEWAQKAIAERGLSDLAEVRHLDYRLVEETDFDAVSSIGLTEHLGIAQLPKYARFLRTKMRPGARLLNHCIMRPATTDKPVEKRGFIPRYVFPDGELPAVAEVAGAIQDAGLEIRHEENLREHYALTLRDWGRNLDAHWEAAVTEVGEPRARVWRAYMAGCQLGFERRQIELHQILAVRTTDSGDARIPLRPAF